jgi:DNA modification methylase
MKIEMRPIDLIKPYPQNPRVNDAAVDAVVASLKEFGWRQAIVVDDEGVIVVGHTRHKAALKMGLTEVPVHVATDLSPAQARAYRIADNQTASIAEWNADLLGLELAGLKEMEFDLTQLGFDADELARLTGTEVSPGLSDPDETPEPPEDAITQPGDLWLLGDHRLLCGDSTKSEDVERLMDGARATLCATDPPYLVDYTGERPDKDGGNKGGKDWSHVYHEVEIKDADAFFRGVFANVVRVIAPKAAIYCWHAHKRQADIDRVWQELGILNHQQVIWVKPVAVFGRMFWHQRHEPCLMGWVQGSMPEFSRDQSLEHGTVWEVDWEGKARVVGNEHPTQKPVELFARPIRRHTNVGDVCFEPFSGSGSQVIAATQEGRRCYAVELEPRFVDVAVQRWEAYTGAKAERVTADGGRPQRRRRGKPGGKANASTEKTPAARAGVKGRT